MPNGCVEGRGKRQKSLSQLAADCSMSVFVCEMLVFLLCRKVTSDTSLMSISVGPKQGRLETTFANTYKILPGKLVEVLDVG